MSKRYPGVRHIKDDIYEINYYPYPSAPRKQYRVKAGSTQEAFLIKARDSAQLKTGTNIVISSFAELGIRLELKLKADNLSPKTIRNLKSQFKNFFERFLSGKHSHITSVNQITRVIIEDYKQWVVVEQGRVTGWRDELAKFKVIIKKLVNIGCCNKEIYYDVLSSFKKPPRLKKLYKEITKSQMKVLLDYIKKNRPDYYGITYFLMRLGWRRSQVLSIKRKNIKWQGLRPVEILIEPEDTKTREPFVLRDIDNELANIIKHYALARKKTIWLFPNRNNNIHHKDKYTAYIKRISQKILGITLTPHDFRHSFCTTRLKEGATPRDIMAITGHKDIDSFNIYTHPTSEGTKRVLERSKLL